MRYAAQLQKEEESIEKQKEYVKSVNEKTQKLTQEVDDLIKEKGWKEPEIPQITEDEIDAVNQEAYMIVKRVKDAKSRFLQERHKQSKKIFDYEERYKELTKELKKKE